MEELEVPTDADGLAGAYALADRLAAKLAVATGAFEAAEGFAVDGSVSLTPWLRARGRLSGTEACRSLGGPGGRTSSRWCGRPGSTGCCPGTRCRRWW